MSDDSEHAVEAWKLGLARDTPHPIARLIERDLSCAEAVDFYIVVVEGVPATMWAQQRGVTKQAISNNVGKAEKKLGLDGDGDGGDDR